MPYRAQEVRVSNEELLDLTEQINREFDQVERTLGDNLFLPQNNVEPAKPRDGQIAYADGTNWDPGDGEGLYIYFNAQWNTMKPLIDTFQPLDSDLTAIAALSTTAFGRALLILANQAALTAAIAIATTSLAGIVELATAAEVRAHTALKYIDAALLTTASATVALSDGATVAVDWSTGINFTLEITADRILGNPTNEIPGTFRTVLVDGNNTTDRILTFGSEYGGEPPTLEDIDSTQMYLLTIFCKSAGEFLVTSIDGSDA